MFDVYAQGLTRHVKGMNFMFRAFVPKAQHPQVLHPTPDPETLRTQALCALSSQIAVSEILSGVHQLFSSTPKTLLYS